MIPFSIFSIHDYTVRYIDNLPIVFFENKTGKCGEFLSLLKETSDATPIWASCCDMLGGRALAVCPLIVNKMTVGAQLQLLFAEPYIFCSSWGET